jgi:magnesium chelatase family protein
LAVIINLIAIAIKKMHLSARPYYEIPKITGTISDLADCEAIQTKPIAEAIQDRSLDGKGWS